MRPINAAFHALFERGISFGLSHLIMVNNTITGNKAQSGGGIFSIGSTSVVLNSIIWSDSAGTGQEISVEDTFSIEITYSDVQGGWEGDRIPIENPAVGWSSHTKTRGIAPGH